MAYLTGRNHLQIDLAEFVTLFDQAAKAAEADAARSEAKAEAEVMEAMEAEVIEPCL
jgi:hypothetical protein